VSVLPCEEFMARGYHCQCERLVVTVVRASDFWLLLSGRVIGGYCCQSECLVVVVATTCDSLITFNNTTIKHCNCHNMAVSVALTVII
jgi:hypothetical protein